MTNQPTPTRNSRTTQRFVATTALTIAATLTPLGCAQRTITITSEPPGARVIMNDTDVGTTPLEVNFTYFGTYDLLLRKPGYEPLTTTADADAPWYEWPGIDLIAQSIPPAERTDIHWHFTLEPATSNEDQLLDRARNAQSLLDPLTTSTEPNPPTNPNP